MADYYLWLKALHIIAVIAWMAGMLYLPRLYVYHCGAPVGSPMSETFKLMENRLLRAIMNPAMIATWTLGLAMVWAGGGETLAGALDWLKSAHWMHGKLTLLVLMQIAHVMLARWRKAFARDERPHSALFFRVFNEVPTVLMIGIVILVVIKPF